MPRISVLLLVLVAICGQAFAQSRTTGALAGHVEEQGGGALSGATLELDSPALIGGVRTTAADAQGRFRFADLPPGQYRLTATAPGRQSMRIERLKVSVGMTAEVAVPMLIMGGEETVVVRAKPVTVDPTSSATPTILTADYLKHVPIDRETANLLDVAPGINIESAYGGGEESGNAYQVDGVDVSDPQGGQPLAFFNYSLLDEVELVGLGAPAEYGQFTGVVFNSVTRSGGNESSGAAELYYGGQAITGNSKIEDLNPSIDSHLEMVFQTGGPLRRDRLWYFVSAQYLHINTNEGGPTQREIDPHLFAKFTPQLRPASTLQGWLQVDRSTVTGSNADEFTLREASNSEKNPGLAGNLLFNTALSQASIVNAAWSGYSGRHGLDPASGFDTAGRFDALSGITSGNARQFAVIDRNRQQLNGSYAHHLYSHDFKVGTEIELSRVRDQYGVPGGAFYTDNEGPVTDPSTGLSDYYTLSSIGGGYDALGKNQRLSVYAQDSWRITPHITLNPGLRIDRNRGKVTGATVFSTNGIAPRLGFAWDLHGNGRSVVKAHYGRYYEALYSAFYYYMEPSAFDPLVTQRTFNASHFTQTLTNIPGQQYAMDPNIKQPYLDQVVLGYEREMGRGVRLDASLVYRKNRNLIETVSRDGIFVPVTGAVPESGQQVTLYDYLNPNTDVLLYTNPKGLNRSYQALILSATRPLTDKWLFAGSYVYSKARGNIDNLGFDEAGIGANTPFFDGHFLDTPNSLVNAEGKLTHDQTHQVKLQGTRLFPRRRMGLSWDYVFHSGDTWTPLTTCLLVNGACHDFPQGPVTYFAEARGSRRIKARSELDLGWEWDHPLWRGYDFHLGVDMFNVLNQERGTSVETLMGTEEFGQPATANFARSLRLGFRVEW
jgi:hypothetical protein